MDKPFLVALLFMVAVTLALVGLIVYFFVTRKEARTLELGFEDVAKPFTRSVGVKQQLSDLVVKTPDPTMWTYSFILRFPRHELNHGEVLLFANGNAGDSLSRAAIMIVIGNSNDMYIALRKAGKASTATDWKAVVESVFCRIDIIDVPFHRFFALDIVYDINTGLCTVYLDGHLNTVFDVKQCDFQSAGTTDRAMQKPVGDTALLGQYLPSPSTTFAGQLTAFTGAEFRLARIHNRLLSGDEVRKNFEDNMKDVYEAIKEEAKAASDTKCANARALVAK